MRHFYRLAAASIAVAICTMAYLVHAGHAGNKPVPPPSVAGGSAAINPLKQDMTGLSKKDAAICWSQWGDYYSTSGPVDMAITCFSKAAQLDPSEPLHHVNLANTISVFRKDSCQYYGLSEQAVFQLALQHYQIALRLEPKSHEYARLLALSYYSLTPMPAPDAMAAWKKVISTAQDEDQKEDAYLNLARICIQTDQFIDAQEWLNKSTDESFQSIKIVLSRRLQEKMHTAHLVSGQASS